MKKIVINAFLITFSIAIGLFFCELFGRFVGLGDPLIYEEDPLVGYRLRPNQKKIGRNNSNISIDHEGFRYNPNQEKTNNDKYIVFVGDSITYGGSYTDDSEIFSSIYCSNIKESICLNSGLNGWGLYNIGRFIRNFSLYSDRNPSEFIVVISPNDVLRNVSQLRGLPWFTSEPKEPKALNQISKYVILAHILPNLESKNEGNEYFQKYWLRKGINQKESNIREKTIQTSFKHFSESIKETNTKVNIILAPPKRWFEETEYYSSSIKLYDEYLKKLSKNNNVSKYCNLYHKIKNNYSPKDFVDSAHLSVSGHKKWEQYIQKCIS
ncbi:SGNH/GDSL hydrolase family protein [Prochlorococcus sp. MIT 0604]|uniref:SGNH/GDSL hydrolase family protein n=1 Tax=Prochlorococcus sp. MIT 0604 TaxID=1501268 RepID=UPI0004F5B802|nr:SGNH/GDSL hydrolase family protein [Prochlorococcus sp. MIT 0604]AIQ94751.1 hypothetical protein EW14_0731 [Prochlorococcus sp. MIT 0604]